MLVPVEPAWGQALGMMGLGFAMAFNPCMLAMGPVAAAYLGHSSTGGAGAGCRQGLAFVLGYALTLALLGTVLTSVGQVAAGELVPWWPYILAGVYWILGLYLLRHQLPRSPFPVKVTAFYCQPYRARWHRSSLPRAFLGGMGVGIVPSPCATPVVMAVSAYLVPSQQYGLAAWVLFFFGLGHGFPSLLSAFLAGSLKSSPWARLVNPVLGLVLVGLGFYFLWQGPELFR